MQQQGLCCVCQGSPASKQARVGEGLRGDTAETAEVTKGLFHVVM